MNFTRHLSIAALIALAACSGPGTGSIPGTSPAGSQGTAHRADTVAQPADTPTGLPADTPTGLPADTPTGLPADTPTGLPADTPTGLPADTPTGLPAGTVTGLPNAHFACQPAQYGDGASCTVAIRDGSPAISDPNAGAAVLPGLHPSDIQAAYQLPNAGGATVAIVDAFDDPNLETELNVYRSAYGLGSCTTANGCFTKLNQSGSAAAYPAANTAWATESALDVEMVSAACPACRIVVVEANSASMNDLGAAVDTAALNSPAAINNSYYVPEWSGQQALEQHYNHAGIAVVASSGDQPYAAFPASSPYVTAVGGTSLSGSNGSYTEQPWTQGGHGCSKYVSAGKYQRALAVPCNNHRSAVDISAVADPSTPVSFYSMSAGGWNQAGGTSVAAAIVAGAYGIIHNAPALGYAYTHPTAFRRLTNGNYSIVTGLGTPLGVGGL